MKAKTYPTNLFFFQDASPAQMEPKVTTAHVRNLGIIFWHLPLSHFPIQLIITSFYFYIVSIAPVIHSYYSSQSCYHPHLDNCGIPLTGLPVSPFGPWASKSLHLNPFSRVNNQFLKLNLIMPLRYLALSNAFLLHLGYSLKSWDALLCSSCIWLPFHIYQV